MFAVFVNLKCVFTFSGGEGPKPETTLYGGLEVQSLWRANQDLG